LFIDYYTILSMFSFLNDADAYLTTFWYISIPVSLLFIIQMVLTFTGLNMETDIDADVHIGDPEGFMEYFTIRNAINFLMGFGWAGVLLHPSIQNKFLLICAAIAVGLIFVAVYFYLAQQITKFEEDNTFNPNELIGAEAEVYLRIPGHNDGHGKIMISHKGTTHVLEAVSLSEDITTGSKVVVEDIQDDNRLVVRNYN